MSTTRTVTVGSIQTKTGKNGDRTWRRFSLLDPDDKFVGSTFSGTVGKFLQEHEGQRIEVDIEEKQGESGTLRDLIDAREVVTTTAEPTVSPTEKHSTIIREVALKAAVEYAAIAGPSVTVDQTLIIADKFASWIASGQS